MVVGIVTSGEDIFCGLILFSKLKPPQKMPSLCYLQRFEGGRLKPTFQRQSFTNNGRVVRELNKALIDTSMNGLATVCLSVCLSIKLDPFHFRKKTPKLLPAGFIFVHLVQFPSAACRGGQFDAKRDPLKPEPEFAPVPRGCSP